jgi:DNA ligase-1
MPDLNDGETIEIQGSASIPYKVKNVAGVYSCTCPAWRNQSLPIDRRTCKHIRRVRGDAAEQARIGTVLPSGGTRNENQPQPPPLLLAETWDGETDPTGWHLSEKLDGVRAYWDGKQFLSRNGNRYFAPDWFCAGLPLEPLDGELWIGRKQFQRTVSIVRRQDGGDLWREVRFVIFDAPAHDGPFEERLDLVHEVIELTQPAFVVAHPHSMCQGRDHLIAELAAIEALGGEGVMLRQPGSRYELARSSTLLKVKRFQDAEAVVVGHEPGSGRHKGRLGALLVQMAHGVRFAVGTGLSDAQRSAPPPVGCVITFRYQELSDRGVPRFPSFVSIREDAPLPSIPSMKGEARMSTASKRRFEFTAGSSDKFWEIQVNGTEVTVRFGRNGSNGLSQTKTFGNEAAARQHAETMIRQKTRKGYIEIA